jgi:hypothetical protein
MHTDNLHGARQAAALFLLFVALLAASAALGPNSWAGPSA